MPADEEEETSSFKGTPTKSVPVVKRPSFNLFRRPKNRLSQEHVDETQIFAKIRRSGDEELVITRHPSDKTSKIGVRFDAELLDGKLNCVEVFPGSLAEKYGLMSGDLIEQINGVRYDDPTEAALALRELYGAIELKLAPRSISRPHLKPGEVPMPAPMATNNAASMLWM